MILLARNSKPNRNSNKQLAHKIQGKFHN